MPEISGIDKETKQKLINYCRRNGLTQIEWVALSLYHDLIEEQANGSTDLKREATHAAEGLTRHV